MTLGISPQIIIEGMGLYFRLRSIGISLQAFGIILEGIGLYCAFRSIGSVKERWLSDAKKGYPALINDVRQEYEKEGRELAKQLWTIAIGLALQLAGLLILELWAPVVVPI